MPATRPPLTVLIIDDNPSDIQLMQLGFEELQIPVRVVAAGDGVAGQEAVRAMNASCHCPDVIFLDINMPKANGWDVLSYVRSHDLCRTTPVIMMTSSSASRDRERSLRLGANQFITKPSTFEQLLPLLQQAVDIHGRSPRRSAPRARTTPRTPPKKAPQRRASHG